MSDISLFNQCHAFLEYTKNYNLQESVFLIFGVVIDVVIDIDVVRLSSKQLQTECRIVSNFINVSFCQFGRL